MGGGACLLWSKSNGIFSKGDVTRENFLRNIVGQKSIPCNMAPADDL